ncbi:malate synthase G [Salinimonas sp. HHU 13199]|uniref:Malate synthase G n=1 Tax=Salinimonas profundi TaxID=2729140 RepID=A0ABR8LLP1_9ALTE|nr:malate synthase G [Salinimonas profundi]MBD3586657.1 malate synthase G [Salinimonas profundi]
MADNTNQSYVAKGRLHIASTLHTFINEQALPGTGIQPAHFWQSFESILTDLTAQNIALLGKRESLQQQIDDYHRAGKSVSDESYQAFLRDIGYLVNPPQEVTVTVDRVDDEVATMAGPQLVVPINNARYALNAANARWGSLYDAFYGTDVIEQDGELAPGSSYNETRGAAVVQKAKAWLDTVIPLQTGSHHDAISYWIKGDKLTVKFSDGSETELKTPQLLAGYRGSAQTPEALLFIHNQLHFELQIDRDHPVGKTDKAGVSDILMEAALSTIMDCEDSVAAVDAEDKTVVYKNWLGLMKGTLSVEVSKNGQSSVRRLNQDRRYLRAGDNSSFTLPGRSLMFVRNVGHLMQNDAILVDGEPVFEGLMDAMVTALIGIHDLKENGEYRNSRKGSIYIVKPKMHGPDEVAFSDTLFRRVEQALGLTENTLKMGIMDEERRTSVNLKACIARAQHRVVFINTGFLDRTGDEIHTSMLAGAFAPKAELKERPWIGAYEKANVVTGLECGLAGKAQIGKGMWPIPDNMAAMMKAKIGHPQAGASTAWVPSPTAATLHALHYHQVDVFDVQKSLQNSSFDGLSDILTIPLMAQDCTLSDSQIQRELDNNVQGILGYVVRWVHQGIGCSKVPDIDNVGLMEDRATLRISSQHIANWLEHGVVSKTQVEDTLARMAALVDEQNAGDDAYIPMTPDLHNSIGYQAACDLIFEGTRQPSGYTEPLLHQRRREMKAKLAQA